MQFIFIVRIQKWKKSHGIKNRTRIYAEKIYQEETRFTRFKNPPDF